MHQRWRTLPSSSLGVQTPRLPPFALIRGSTRRAGACARQLGTRNVRCRQMRRAGGSMTRETSEPTPVKRPSVSHGVEAKPFAPRTPRYRPVEDWGQMLELWSLREATSLAVDADNNVVVFNRGEHPVIVFDSEGKFVRAWGEGLFRHPHAITIGPDGSYWLTDDLHHTVRKFSATGKLLLTLGEGDRPSSLQSGRPFNRPTHVALCPHTGEIYVSDGYGNSQVHKFDPAGRYLFSWGRARH